MTHVAMIPSLELLFRHLTVGNIKQKHQNSTGIKLNKTEKYTLYIIFTERAIKLLL